MTGAEILLECLKKQGVNVIFGIPGSLTREIDAALYKNKRTIQYILARHEAGASFMADGYAWVTGDVGVCLTIPGPGAANAYAGILEAYIANVPVLLITAQNYSCYGKKDFSKMTHGLDQLTAFGPVTKCVKRVELVEKIPETIYEIFGALRSGRPKPVLLEITRDALASEMAPIIPEKNEGNKSKAPDEQIKQAVNLLAKSKRPFILAGRSVYQSRACAKLFEFAKIIQSPVATTKMGKGAISEKEFLSLGDFGNKIARDALADSDLVFAIGAQFTQIDMDNWSLRIPHPLICIDNEPGQIDKEYIPDVGIVADIKLTLEQLLFALKDYKSNSSWGKKLDIFKKMLKTRKTPRYIREFQQVLSPNTILSVDVHMAGYMACTHFRVEDAGKFLHSPISMSVGYALPAAIGAKIARPDYPVIAFCGDGGFILSSPEFATVMKYKLNIVIIVINDNAFGTVKDVQLCHFGQTLGVEVYNPDFIKFAECFGAHGFRVENINDFESILEKALTLNKPVLIEVIPKRSLKGKVFYGLKNITRKLRFIAK